MYGGAAVLNILHLVEVTVIVGVNVCTLRYAIKDVLRMLEDAVVVQSTLILVMKLYICFLVFV